jgi:short subunit dehydrogenase-like uncharacterized protein
MTNEAERKFDVVVFGATSFVGQILCRHLVARHGTNGKGVNWAIAGRSASKLAEVAKSTGANVEQIVADASDTAAMTALVRSTRLVISTVGPYALYGSELVAACAVEGTDYCDLTGEPQWMQKMIDTHSNAAVASGARIVHTCGFDSIPSDLGTWFTQQQAKAKFGSTCTQIKMRVKSMKGAASGGTVASMMNLVEEVRKNPSLRKVLSNPYALNPIDMRAGVRQPNVTIPEYDTTAQTWVGPFVMASVNTRIVQRTHALLGRPWGEGFLYDEAMIMGKGPGGVAKATALAGGLAGFMGAAAIGPVRSLLNKYVLPKPGEGPSVTAQEKGFYDLRFFGKTAAGQTIVTKVTGDQDPGYGSTAKMLGEAAICLLEQPRSVVGGGFWTPATALGNALVTALGEHAGMTFEVVE